jgi:hypothetical protein
VHQQIRFTFGSDVGAPTTTLALTGTSHAYLTGFPYVLYYGTTLGGGAFTLHESATDPSGVDTIALPDLSGTTGFGGSGGTSTNNSSVDPFVATANYIHGRPRRCLDSRTSPPPTSLGTPATTRWRSSSTTQRRPAAP